MKFLVQRETARVPMSEERFYLVLVTVMAAFVAALVTSFALGLHRNFLTIACDTAVLQSGIVNTLHGHWFDNNGAGGPNILGSHTTFLLLLVMPIYVLAPSADTLFILQVWGVYSLAVPLYLVAGNILRKPVMAFCVAAAALVSPLLLHMAVAPFHLETWIVAAVLWSYFFYLRNNLAGFCASMAFAVCCGEQAAMIYIALGAALLLVKDGLAWRKRYGTIALACGFAWILLAVLVVGPLARGARTFNIFAYNYTEWNIKSVSGLPLAVAEDPLKAIKLLFSPYRWIHVAENIGLPLFIAFLSWRSFLLLAPVPIYFLMCDQEFYLYFHAYYYSFAFVAGYLGVLFFLARRDVVNRLGITLLAATLLFNVILLCGTAGYYIQLAAGRDDDFSNVLHRVFDSIPPEAAVYSPHRYSAYLSNRQYMVIGDLREEKLDFKSMMDARFPDTNVRPEQVDFIVCDYLNDQCGWRQGNLDSDLVNHRVDNVNHLLQSGEWKLYWTQSDVAVLQRVPK